MKNNWKTLAAFVVACLGAGLIGSFFTFENIPTWFAGIKKPDFSPPNWVFGPVWTTLYILMGISAYIVWEKGRGKPERKSAMGLFALQLVLNTLWSILFFGMRNPFYAFVEIVFLWLGIAGTIMAFSRISKNAALLMVPYLLWVSFAAYLNYAIWRLNI
jgi:benzodiazapine receptor